MIRCAGLSISLRGKSLALYLTRSTVDAVWDVIKPWLELRVQARFLSFVTRKPYKTTLRTTTISRAACRAPRGPLHAITYSEEGILYRERRRPAGGGVLDEDRTERTGYCLGANSAEYCIPSFVVPYDLQHSPIALFVERGLGPSSFSLCPELAVGERECSFSVHDADGPHGLKRVGPVFTDDQCDPIVVL